jgi:alkylhydroperoxidase/carboxymuconolactone decarboxylase family protein YurZ
MKATKTPTTTTTRARGPRRLVALAGLLLAVAAPSLRPASARAAGLWAGAPELDRDTGQLSLFALGTGDDGAPTPLATPAALVGARALGAPSGREKLGDFAADHPKWLPPVAIGAVYLWAKGSPPAVVEGLEAFFKHLPARTPVHPTLYGQGYRKVITKVTAARAAGGDLADYAPLPGDQMKLLDALRFNARKLAEIRAPLRLLLVVTDGRDAGADRGAFGALGEEMRKLGLLVQVVSFPAPVDAAENAANVRALVSGAAARHLVAERPADLPALVESLSEAVTGVERLRWEVPLGARLLGGEQQVRLSALVGGAALEATAGTVVVPGRGALIFGLLAAALLAGGGGAAFLLLRRQKGGGGMRRPGVGAPAPRGAAEGEAASAEEVDDPLHLLLEASLRLGLKPDRILVEILARHPERLGEVVALEPDDLPEGCRAARSLAGAPRLTELKALASRVAAGQLDEELLRTVAAAAQTGAAPAEAARLLKTRASVDRWGAFMLLPPARLAAAAAQVPRSPAGVDGATYLAEVQRLLPAPAGAPVVVVWLVRVAGPGARGETLVVDRPACSLGGADADLVLGDEAALGDARGEVRTTAGQVVLEEVDGEVEVDGRIVTAPTPLTDGALLRIGRCSFVVRLVRGAVPAEALATPRRPRTSRSPTGRSRPMKG